MCYPIQILKLKIWIRNILKYRWRKYKRTRFQICCFWMASIISMSEGLAFKAKLARVADFL